MTRSRAHVSAALAHFLPGMRFQSMNRNTTIVHAAEPTSQRANEAASCLEESARFVLTANPRARQDPTANVRLQSTMKQGPTNSGLQRAKSTDLGFQLLCALWYRYQGRAVAVILCCAILEFSDTVRYAAPPCVLQEAGNPRSCSLLFFRHHHVDKAIRVLGVCARPSGPTHFYYGTY